MQLSYDENLIESALFLCTSGRRKGATGMQIARFHREREKLYSLLDLDERNAAFFKLHLDWFREWGLEQSLTGVLREFPLIRERLGVLAVRQTHRHDDEGAELYVNEAKERTGMLALRLERLMKDAALRDYLRHEFTHLHDMLDPAFGYSPTLDLPGLNSAQKRLARERYRLLWDITIDGRLETAGHAPMQLHDQHAAAFARGYSFWPEQKRTETFSSLWECRAPRHSDFLRLISDPRGLRDARRPEPGASCPLCDFPTFQWANAAALPPAILQRIIAEFPAWQPAHSLCSRCLETYEAVAGHPAPFAAT